MDSVTDNQAPTPQLRSYDTIQLTHFAVLKGFRCTEAEKQDKVWATQGLFGDASLAASIEPTRRALPNCCSRRLWSNRHATE